MNLIDFELMRKDLLIIEKDVSKKEKNLLGKEEQFIDLLLRNEADKLVKQNTVSLTDEEMRQIWESFVPGIIPASLNKRVSKIICSKTVKKTKSAQEYLNAPARFALAFRKEAQLDETEADLVKSAIKRAKERLRSQEGEEE